MPKTIDERLDALAQSVELLAGMQKTNEQHLGQLIDALTRLVRIVEDHERRLDNLTH